MKTVIISEFKARCIGLLKQVKQTGEPLTVTLRGKPLARVEAATPAAGSRTLGAQKASTRYRGDLVHFDFSRDWECGNS